MLFFCSERAARALEHAFLTFQGPASCNRPRSTLRLAPLSRTISAALRRTSSLFEGRRFCIRADLE
jgi:hypothetical protein